MPLKSPLTDREKRLLNQNEPSLSKNPPGIDLPDVMDRFADAIQAEIDASGGGPGGASITTGSTIWVDSTYGDDGTGTADLQDLPYATIAAAIAAASAGDLIRVRGGTYTESGLTLPAGVDLAGDGWGNTLIGDTAAVADVLTISSSIVSNFTVICPATAALSGIVHTAGTGGVYSANIAGNGATGAGNGIRKTGTGKLIGGNIRCETGGLTYGLLVDSGVLAFDDVHFPATPGASISAALRTEGTGRFQGQGFNCGNPACTDGVSLGGTSTCLVFSPNIFNVATAVHITADGVNFTSTGGKILAANLTVEVDLGLTGTGSTVEALATVLEPIFSFPPAAAVNTNFVLNFQQLLTDTRLARQRLIGADLALGFPELGSGLWVGRGAAYVTGILVFTSDGTDTATTVGGNLTDESTAASSLDASTFTFQGTTANHCIYIGTARRDAASTPLKHWGAEILTAVAGVGGSYVVEAWDGAAWTALGTMSVGAQSGFVYGDSLFIRAASNEDVRWGLDDSSTWVQTSVNGQTAYWIRVRIATTVTTLPTFEQWRLIESATHLNGIGQLTADGLAQWKQTLVGAGNVFASGGTTTDGTATVGTGGGTWTHDLDNAKLNASGDAVSTQFVIPAGVNTAFGITFRVSYEYAQYSAAPTIEGRILGVERQGVLIADSAGGLTPVPRAEGDTALLTAVAGQVDSRVLSTTTTGVILTEEFGPYSIESLYAGDLVLFQLDLVADGGGGGAATDIQLWAIEVEGTRFSPGRLA
jgi:hypothetical protein